MTPRRRIIWFSVLLCSLAFAYCYNLDGTGVVDPDEPRYAAIGQAMAANGDWITPRLWGSPWFEKPPLVYWMMAAGTRLHLAPDLAGRLPVALLSLAFVVTFYFLLRREFGEPAAAIAALALATSAGWVIYSSFCLTDVPMAVFFSLALLLALRLMRGQAGRRTEDRGWIWFACGVCLGLATLAKALVPLVLSLPVFWFLRLQWKRWWLLVLGIVVIAGPWYALMLMRHGRSFIQVFFVEQQLSRVYSSALQHVQPAYYYVPVVLALLFPWTPLLLALRPAAWRSDRRAMALATVVVFGFLFFSTSLNKLPGYLLPLMPALFALVGVSAARTGAVERRSFLVACAALIALIPFMGELTPVLLTTRLTSMRQVLLALLPVTSAMLVLFITPLLVAMLAQRTVAALLLILCVAVALTQVRYSIYPALDDQASPRGLWREIKPEADNVCDAGLHRAWEYGLAFYRGRPIPLCGATPKPVRLTQRGAQRPVIDRSQRPHPAPALLRVPIRN